MLEQDFEKLVKRALISLPKHIRKEIDNLAIVIEKRPSQRSLLGLYQGVPKTSWGRGFGQILPDKITIFQEPIENWASSRPSGEARPREGAAPQEIAELVRLVVWHEIAHHFGFSEKKVRELEAKWRKRI